MTMYAGAGRPNFDQPLDEQILQCYDGPEVRKFNILWKVRLGFRGFCQSGPSDVSLAVSWRGYTGGIKARAGRFQEKLPTRA